MTHNQRKSLQHAGYTFEPMSFTQFQARFNDVNPEEAYWDQEQGGAWIAPKRNVLGTLAVLGGIAALAAIALSFVHPAPDNGHI